MMSLSSAVSHFLNCFLGSFPSPHAQITAEELQSKKTRRKNNRKNKAVLVSIDNTEWVNDTPKTIWKKVVDEVQDYFQYTLDCDSIDSALERYNLQRVSLLRQFCLKAVIPTRAVLMAHLALYCFANSQVSIALRLMYETRYLALLCHGDNHPEVALIDSNIGLILHAAEEYDLSLRFLENALQINSKFHGAKSLKVAMNYHLVARTHSCRGDFRAALQSEKEAFTIYKHMVMFIFSQINICMYSTLKQHVDVNKVQTVELRIRLIIQNSY
ncbi:CLU1 [Mytilus edulis]|uniref:TIF31 n=1 Tax=Mytilus edulis TaxID=6550 RepID=A0A8S3QWH1_MYTED|nr:CLU1 [Mytilus edulis]